MPQYAGMPEDTHNKKVEACGCVYRWTGIPADWVRFDRCEEHRD